MMLALGLILVLKKVAEMERYHELRVGVLTTLLSVILLVSWAAFAYSFEDHWEGESGDHFTLTEM